MTSTTSAFVGLSVDVTKGMVDIVAKPVQVFQRASPRALDRTAGDPNSASPTANSPALVAGSTQQALEVAQKRRRNRSCGVPAREAAVVSIAAATGVVASYAKGIFVDVPLATTEGLRVVPRLYGQQVRDYGPIRDWKSGMQVAGKNFAYGLTEGVMDFFFEPFKGAYQEGVVGAAKGFGKAFASAGTKIPSGK